MDGGICFIGLVTFADTEEIGIGAFNLDDFVCVDDFSVPSKERLLCILDLLIDAVVVLWAKVIVVVLGIWPAEELRVWRDLLSLVWDFFAVVSESVSSDCCLICWWWDDEELEDEVAGGIGEGAMWYNNNEKKKGHQQERKKKEREKKKKVRK